MAKYGNCYNFCLIDANNFIFTPDHNIHKRNISWRFGENQTWWRHVTSFYRFLTKNCRKVLKKCWRQQKLPIMILPIIIYLKEHCISFTLRGQPLSGDKRLNSSIFCFSFRIFNFCRIFDDVITKNADVSKIFIEILVKMGIF